MNKAKKRLQRGEKPKNVKKKNQQPGHKKDDKCPRCKNNNFEIVQTENGPVKCYCTLCHKDMHGKIFIG
jgi:hypothetical protein